MRKTDNCKGETKTSQEIARKLCEHAYLKLCEQMCELPATDTAYSLEEYWKKNERYFIEQAEIYLEVKACLDAK